MSVEIPAKQTAVQLVGPGEMKINREKEVFRPGARQILAQVEAVGLCFSDLKLLKQFSSHVRKSEVVDGIAQEVLRELPSYVPGDQPTVPGHEVVCRIVAVGDAVRDYKVGERYLVQPDFRVLKTAGSNGAFGYNFEGALQQYILLDERVLVEPSGERYFLPVEDKLGASQAALTEPWACVEDSYVTAERQTIKPGGKLLVVAEEGHAVKGIAAAFSSQGKPAAVTARIVSPDQKEAIGSLGIPEESIEDIASLPDEGFDDIVYFGANKQTVEALNSKLAAGAIMNIVTAGKKFGELVSVGVGRMHYGNTRWVGTLSGNAADSYKTIPETGEVRDGDSILVIGAGGPMGQMHVIRALCLGMKELSVVATDFDDARLESLAQKAEPIAKPNGYGFRTANPQKDKLDEEFSYFTVMAPVGELVANSIKQAKPGAIVNIFAGIPAPVSHPIDLDRVIERQVFLFGTSGSSIEDIKIVLRKVTGGSLNTDASVDAISGMAGAIEGIEAVENRTMAGKIIVYPRLTEVGLIRLSELDQYFPTVAAKLNNGQWCKLAEEELLRVATQSKG